MASRIEGRSRELLEAKNFCNVATIGEDGTPDAVVVWVDVEGGDVVLNSAEGRSWPEALRRDPRVTLSVVNGENPYEYVVVKGRAVELTTDGADEHIDEMAKKYLGQDEYPFRAPGEVRIKIRVSPERVSHRTQ